MNKEKKVTVVAECTIEANGAKEITKSFDKTWHRANELPIPVHVTFNGFVRV